MITIIILLITPIMMIIMLTIIMIVRFHLDGQFIWHFAKVYSLQFVRYMIMTFEYVLEKRFMLKLWAVVGNFSG